VKIFCPAKINLYLKVLGRRLDGYHELRTLMVPLSLGDVLDLERTAGSISLDARGCGCSERENLAWRAASLFMERTGVHGGVSIGIEKRIPVGSGLGGGSSDASGVLLAMDELFHTALGVNELAAMAGELGADCPFFIYRRPLLMGARGDRPIKDVELADRHYLLVVPPVNVSTALVFSRLNLPLTDDGAMDKIKDNNSQCIEPEHWVENDLESAAFAIYPEIAGIKDELIGSGALRAGMSGSGSAFFGVYASHDHLLHAMGRLARHEGYLYVPTTRMTGDVYGDHRGQGVSGQG
jgi:4-diphosphocytidyl-2-C-methyl-D-erythritol kinase